MRRPLIFSIALGLAATVASPWSALADGDAVKGEAVFKAKCAFCHGVAAGEKKMGPTMAGIYGMKAGTADYAKYVGLKDVDFVWDDESLDGFIASPKAFLGGPTSMGTIMKDEQARADVIAYLKTLK